MCKNMIYENCPFKTTIEEWDDDDGDIIALICEGCQDRDECSEKDYDVMETHIPEWKFTRKIKMIRKECNVCRMQEGCIISHAVNTIMDRPEEEWDADTNRNCELMGPVISFAAEWCPHVDKKKLKGDVAFFKINQKEGE